MSAVVEGRIYSIPSGGNGRSKLTVKVLKALVLNEEYTSVYALRVRPGQLNVTFGQGQTYVRRTDRFIQVGTYAQ